LKLWFLLMLFFHSLSRKAFHRLFQINSAAQIVLTLFCGVDKICSNRHVSNYCLIWSNKHCSKNIILKTVVPANFYVSWKCRFQSCRAKLYEEENSNKMVFTYKKNSDRCDNTSTHVWHTTSKFYKLCWNFKKILPTFLDIKQTLSANWRFRGWIPPVALGF
jgi:hypothetical protein